jgi:hypothetical protein
LARHHGSKGEHERLGAIRASHSALSRVVFGFDHDLPTRIMLIPHRRQLRNGLLVCVVGDFQDSFTLILPAGLTVTSAQVVITNFTYGNGVAVFQIGEVFLPPFTAITGNGTYVFPGDSTNFPPGSLNILRLAAWSINNPGSIPPSGLVAGGFNYTLQYQVAAVPEPSTAAPIAIGLWIIVTKRCGRRIWQTRNPQLQGCSAWVTIRGGGFVPRH